MSRFEKMKSRERKRLIDRCVEAARASGVPQVELVQHWLEQSDFDPGDLEAPTEFFAHDPRAYRDRSKRTLIGPGQTLWQNVHARLPTDTSRCRKRSVRYELPTGKLVADPDNTNLKTDLVTFCSVLGDTAYTLKLLGEIEAIDLDSKSDFMVSVAWEDIGQRDKALARLEKALDNGLSLTRVDGYPGFRNLRADARDAEITAAYR